MILFLFNKNVKTRCIERGSMRHRAELAMQPIYNYDTGTVEYIEVLIRGYKGMDNVKDILNSVQSTGTEKQFDIDVLVETLNVIKGVGIKAPVCVNLCPNTLACKGIGALILKIIDKYGVERSQIVIEANELTDFSNMNVQCNLDTLHSNNVKIALDDFGSGNTTLLCLVYNEFDIIKIDRAFITNDHWNNKEQMLRYVKRLVDGLKLQVIVEGIETLQRLKEVRQLGFGTVQGYIYHRPMLVSEIRKVNC